MTPTDLLTKSTEDFMRELFNLLDPIKKVQNVSQQKWYKSQDARKRLGNSHGKLQQLQDDGTLPCHKQLFKPWLSLNAS